MIVHALVVALIANSAASMAVPAEEVRAHRSRMIATELLQQKIESALTTKSRRRAKEGAAALVPLLADEQRYWERVDMADIQFYADRNLATARRLTEEARRGDLKAVSLSLDSLRSNCVACHGRHPETRMKIGH